MSCECSTNLYVPQICTPAVKCSPESALDGIEIPADVVTWYDLVAVPGGGFGTALIVCQGIAPVGNPGNWVSKLIHFGFISFTVSVNSGKVYTVSQMDDANSLAPDFDLRLTGTGTTATLQVRLREAIPAKFRVKLVYL